MKLKIKKRDGRVVPYDVKKVEISIKKAMESVGIENGEDIVFLVEEKIKEINKYPISIEDVQDIIEECLMDLGYNSVAKSYILYREKHKRQRQLKDTLEIVDDLKLGLNAAKLLKTRYLERDIEGKIVETPSELFRRVV
jgi:ribonucleoside-diphosphate reductase alpha chain